MNEKPHGDPWEARGDGTGWRSHLIRNAEIAQGGATGRQAGEAVRGGHHQRLRTGRHRSPRGLHLDVMQSPPRKRRPFAEKRLTFEQMIELMRTTYHGRNDPPFEWATESD